MMRALMFTLILTLLPMLAVAAKNPKRGLAYAESDALANDLKQANGTSSVLTWSYNWGSQPPAYLSSPAAGLEYVPMQWGLGGIESFADAVIAQGATHVLGFNEPDNAGQSNISPAAAAQAWLQYIDPLHEKGIKLGAPAVTNGGFPGGPNWMLWFLGNCTACHIDFIPVHWYGSGIGNFYDYIWSFYFEMGATRPLWITEFADTDSDESTVYDFLNQTTVYLDTLDSSVVERYSWFAFARSNSASPQPYLLLNDDGTLNELGDKYILGKGQ